MNNNIHPCLWFNGQAKEAATFYCSIFSNANITADTPMVVNWEIEGKPIMGLNGGPMFKINPSISLFVVRKEKSEVDRIYDRLIDGGEALMPIDKYDWSERYGWVKDKFDMTWQVMLGEENSICPSLIFTAAQFGRAEEAMEFWTSLFENSSVGMKAPFPAETPYAGKLMFAEFTLDNYKLTAMDGPGEHHYTFNEAVSLVVECEHQAEIDHFWNAMTTNGGEESMCGWLKDKFAVSWQIIPKTLGKLMSDPERGGRVMQALMKMKKLDIEALENA
jgi:predicted 3-demethylubiquinone-9 3-methyltransferase (glyoxalase superfamily)